jgi:hypothetical protein
MKQDFNTVSGFLNWYSMDFMIILKRHGSLYWLTNTAEITYIKAQKILMVFTKCYCLFQKSGFSCAVDVWHKTIHSDMSPFFSQITDEIGHAS